MTRLILIVACVFFTNMSYSQTVGIGTNLPDSSAILDLSSDSLGFLVPRMATSQRNMIENPAKGLKIFNTDDLCEDIFDGLHWVKNCGYVHVNDTIVPADQWHELDSMPYRPGAFGMFNFRFGTKIIIGLGGRTTFPTNVFDIWEYDVVTKVWTKKNNFPGTGRRGMFSFVIDNKGYIAASLSDQQVWEYLPETDTWIQKADFPGVLEGYPAGFTIGNKAYMGTGDYFNDFWEYTPATDTWVQLPDVPGPGRQYATGFSIGNKGYIGLGRGPTSSDYLSDIYEFDPTNNTWVVKQPFLGGGASSLIEFVIKDTAYIGLGTFNNNIQPWMYKFVPNASGNQWTQINSFPDQARAAAFSIVVDNKAYVGCGVDGAYNLNDFWVYNPYPDTLQIYKPQIPYDAYNVQVEVSGDLHVKGKTSMNHNAPLTPLHIKGIDLTQNSHIRLEASNSKNYGSIYYNNNIYFRNSYANGDFGFVNSSGNILLSLDQSGNLIIDGTAAKPGGGSWSATSDRRLKQNIKPYYDGLDQIKLINPIKFHYNDKSDYDTSNEYIGIIAQDLHEVAPYMVYESKKVAPDGSAYLEVDNSSMTYMLINAVKELAQQNEELKKLLATTRSSNEIEFKNLKAEIDDIKKQLLQYPTKTIKDFE